MIPGAGEPQGGVHHGDYGCATPVIGSGRWSYPGDCGHVILVVQSGGWGHPGNCVHVTTCTVFAEGCLSRHCGGVTLGPGSGR